MSKITNKMEAMVMTELCIVVNGYGAECEHVSNIFPSKHDHNVPCAVCYTSTKEVQLMIPAKTVWPTLWTTEYVSYLMTDYYDHKKNAVYECVDKDAESIYGSSVSSNGALFYFILGTYICLACPPYVNNRVITCVVYVLNNGFSYSVLLYDMSS